ncbi:MAG: glycosyltransferase family 4 protein [Bacteroidetes Order II. Incertae sedis bacterium]|nr:glycosyltransferase family 4 protein [Bacteroidetes Order II. bacterium]
MEFFDALSALDTIRLKVLYEFATRDSRSWDRPELQHEHCFLNDVGTEEAMNFIGDSQLVVFSGYRNVHIRQLINQRHAAGLPWVYWAEKPGVISGWLGRCYRRLFFKPLRDPRVPVWGMGNWAVNAWRLELGVGRLYCNIPYHSRLDSFLELPPKLSKKRPTRILFSGSLIRRKGVDLLVEAFLRLAREMPDLELHLVGEGSMRESLGKKCKAVSDRVVFHGFRQWHELPSLYTDADILCAPSRYDGWGLIIPEGLAAGILVVSTDQTGAALELIDEEIGWVVPANQTEPLVESLRSAIMCSSRERNIRIANGRRRVMSMDVRGGTKKFSDAVGKSLASFQGHEL